MNLATDHFMKYYCVLDNYYMPQLVNESLIVCLGKGVVRLREK